MRALLLITFEKYIRKILLHIKITNNKFLKLENYNDNHVNYLLSYLGTFLLHFYNF